MTVEALKQIHVHVPLLVHRCKSEPLEMLNHHNKCGSKVQPQQYHVAIKQMLHFLLLARKQIHVYVEVTPLQMWLVTCRQCINKCVNCWLHFHSVHMYVTVHFWLLIHILSQLITVLNITMVTYMYTVVTKCLNFPSSNHAKNIPWLWARWYT